MMKKINITFLAICTIGISVAYQIHCAIHGFDLTDEGYLMSIYQWFGEDVRYAQGSGGYPFTGYLGWLLNNIFPQGGILGMRLWGVFFVTVTEIFLFCYLKRYFGPGMVLVGLLVQSFFVAQDPKPYGYNTLTALVSCLALVSMIEGCIKEKKLFLLGSGALLGLNVFIRIPNLSCLAFLLLPCIYNVNTTKDLQIKKSTQQVITVMAGFLISVACSWLFLVSIGADKLIIDLVGSMGETLGGKSTHSSSSLITKYVGNLILSIGYFLVFVFALLVGTTAQIVKPKWMRLFVWLVVFQIIYRTTYLYTSVLGDTLLAMMNGLGLFGACVYFATDHQRRILALGAILLSLVIPLGSDGGYQTMWVGTWLSLPIGLSGFDYFIRKSKEQPWSINFGTIDIGPIKGKSYQKELKISTPRSLQAVYYFCLFTLVTATVAKVENRAYYDPGHKSKKVFPIKSHMAKGVYTSQERADIINPLLEEIGHYVKPGEVMLVYDSSPLIYYLTQTKPFAGISWPCVFYGGQYVRKFREAEQEMSYLPVVVMQNFWTSNTWGKPEGSYYDTGTDAPFSTKEMKKTMLHFIRKHNYRIAWSNKYYHILVSTDECVKELPDGLPSSFDMYTNI
jgi:hypothetical protein